MKFFTFGGGFGTKARPDALRGHAQNKSYKIEKDNLI